MLALRASSLKLIDAPVVLGLSKYGLDHRLAFSVEPAAKLAGEHVAHEGVAAAVPAAAGRSALAGVGRSLRRYGIGSRAAAISWLRLASASLIRSTVAS